MRFFALLMLAGSGLAGCASRNDAPTSGYIGAVSAADRDLSAQRTPVLLAQPQQPQSLYSSQSSVTGPTPDTKALKVCLRAEIEGDFARVPLNDAESNEKLLKLYGYDHPSAQLRSTALNKCVPSGTPTTFEQNIFTQVYHAVKEEVYKITVEEQLKNAQLERDKYDAKQKELEQLSKTLTREWGLCLEASVTVSAIISNEPATVLIDAAFAECSAERSKVEELHKRYGDNQISHVLDLSEQKISKYLALDILRARAAGSVGATPRSTRPPAPSQTHPDQAI